MHIFQGHKLHGSRALVLARVSTDMERQQSVPAQVNIGRGVAKNLELTVPEGYVVIGEDSRSKWPRPEMVEAFRIIATDPEVAALIAWEGKRAWGDAAQQQMIFDHLRRHKVLMFDGSGRCLNGTSMGEIMSARTDAFVAELEVMQTRERVRSTHMARFEYEGVWLLKPAHGFKAVPVLDGDKQPVIEKNKVKKKIVLDVTALATVEQIFLWAGRDRLSCYEIVKRLNALGIPTPRNASSWRSTTVARIIRNPIYAGEMWWGRRETQHYSGVTRQVLRDADEHKMQPSPFGVVIGVDEDEGRRLFVEANHTLGQRQNFRAKRVATAALDCLVYCERCNHQMSRIQNGRRNAAGKRAHTYQYRCSSAVNFKSGQTMPSGYCTQYHSFSERKVLDRLRTLVEQLGAGASDTEVSVVLPARRDGLDHARERVTKLEAALVRCREAYEAGVDSMTEYGENKKRLTGQLDAAREDLERVERETSSPLTTELALSARRALSRLLDSLDDEAIPMENRQAAARRLVERIYVDSPRVRVVLRDPEAALASAA